MPKIIINGREIQIPYDPFKIAELIYKGCEIHPDEGLPKEEIQRHNQEIGMHLREMWGNKQFRTIPKTFEALPNQGPAIPSEGLRPGEEQGFLRPYGTPREFNMMDVAPNPYQTEDSGIFRNIQPKPLTQEAKNTYPSSGLLDWYIRKISNKGEA